MQPRLIDQLPEIYRHLLSDSFLDSFQDEAKATCQNCPMTKESKLAMAKIPLQGFHVSTKCCSYQPGHVNYLVGGLLKDQDPQMAEGRRRMRSRIDRRLGLPYGVSAPPELRRRYESMQEGAVAQRSDLVCEFYAKETGGTCTIWRHREAVCSTFFCKHMRGAEGRKFWMALKDYLEVVEDQLSRYVTYRVSRELFERSEVKMQMDPDAEDMPYEEVWGDYMGREVEFYVACFDIARSLKPADLEKITGVDGMIEADRLLIAKQLLNNPILPPRLKISSTIESFEINDQELAVMGYLKSDAVRISKAAFATLSRFDGKSSTDQVLMNINATAGVQIEQSLLRDLIDHRVLVED